MTEHARHEPIDDLEAELVRLLYQHPWWMSVVVGLAASAGTAYMFSGLVAVPWLFAWLVLLNGVIALRVVLAYLFRSRPLAIEDYASWGARCEAVVWLNGLAWGLPALALGEDDLTVTFFYAMVAAAFVVGAIPQLSYRLRAYYGFAVLTVAPLSLRLLLFEETVFHILGALAILFLLINIAAVRISHQRIRQNIRLETENRRLVERLTVEKQRAEQANRAKSRFLAAASHDLRQPMHALGLFIDALTVRQLDDVSRSLVDNIKLSTQSLQDLLDSLLDISRLDAGIIKVEARLFPLSALFGQLEREFEADAQAKGLSFRVRPCDMWTCSDPTLISRILRNVLSNALRFTDSGGILVGCRRRGRELSVEVYDSGQGMSSGELQQAFEEFYQVENSKCDPRQGLGLGLSIVKRLSLLLGHKTQMFSIPGKGTSFRIRIPEAWPDDSPAEVHKQASSSISGASVLVIDDEASVRLAMAEMLGAYSCVVTVADSEESALAQCRDNRISPDVIIADYRLAGERTGVQAIEALRNEVRREVPSIIVTGDTAPDRLLEAHASGYHLLHKPVSPDRLRNLLGILLDSAQN